MTIKEAKRCLQSKLDCMSMCDTFDCKNTDECERCNLMYGMGTYGEHREALRMAIKALESVEEYKEAVKMI